jgi:hypothetical protein
VVDDQAMTEAVRLYGQEHAALAAYWLGAGGCITVASRDARHR